MLSRIWPAILSLTIPWGPETCTYGGGGGDAGASGSSVAGRAGAASSGGATSSHGGCGGANTAGHAGLSGGGLDAGGKAGTSGEGTSSAGSAGTSGEGTAGTGVQPGSFTFSPPSLFFTGTCEAFPGTATITNTSSVALTWHVTDTPSISFTPPSSTLAPGESVDVGVAVSVVDRGLIWQATVSIDADVAPSQTVDVSVSLSGKYHSPLPADVDFGDTPISSTPWLVPAPGAPNTRFIPADGRVIAEVLGGNNPAFSTAGVATVSYVSGFGMGWLLVFTPQTPGPQEATFTIWSYMTTVCPPNTFKVRGVGVAP